MEMSDVNITALMDFLPSRDLNIDPGLYSEKRMNWKEWRSLFSIQSSITTVKTYIEIRESMLDECNY